MGVITIQIAVNKIDRNTGQIEGLPKNPRFIRDEKFELLKKSIQENPEMLGLRELLVYPIGERYVVIGGNMRLEACKALGYQSVPCKVLNADTPVETLRAYTIKDNAGFGEWDWDAIANEWDTVEVAEWGVDVPEWETEEEPQQESKEDDFDETKDEIQPIAQKGDIWLLGQHRLMCGDSTDADCIGRLMDGQKADIAFTSPPYNAGSLDIPGQERTGKKYNEYDDNKTTDEYIEFLKTNVGLLIEHANEVFYNVGVVAGSKVAIIELLYEYRDMFKDFIYWKKSNPVNAIAHGVISSAIELIMCFGENNTRRFNDTHFTNGEYYLGVIEGSVASNNEYAKIHKATFPMYLPTDILNNFTSKGSTVLDCFGGTGTTLIAAEQLGRKCYMMELDSHYCDVIIARWEKLTGQTATKL